MDKRLRRGISDVAFAMTVVMAVIAVSLLVGAGMWGCPRYNVWLSHQAGEGEFAQAEANRKILVQTAEARLEAAKLEADAEIERARGVAEANKIIGEGLNGKEEYLRYLWITGLRDGHSEVIYIPTEAGLPILEAGRLNSSEHTARMNAEKVGAVEDELSGRHVHVGAQSGKQIKE